MTTTGGGSEKLVYKPVFDAFLASLSDRATDDFRDELKRAGLNLDKLLPGYGYDVWEKAVLAGSKLFPDRSKEEAIHEIGRRLATQTVAQSSVSKTLLPVLKLMGTARAVKRIYSRSTSENYNEVTFGAETPKSLVMHMSYVGNIPDMARGSVMGMGECMGLPLRAKIIEFTPPSVSYLVEWE